MKEKKAIALEIWKRSILYPKTFKEFYYHIKFWKSIMNRRCSTRKLFIKLSQRFQPFRIFWDCPEIKHLVPKSWNTINLSQIKVFSFTFEETLKFLFFHSPNFFIYKLISSSTAGSTIFKYFKSRRWCLLKNSPLSVLLYINNFIRDRMLLRIEPG